MWFIVRVQYGAVIVKHATQNVCALMCVRLSGCLCEPDLLSHVCARKE